MPANTDNNNLLDTETYIITMPPRMPRIPRRGRSPAFDEADGSLAAADALLYGVLNNYIDPADLPGILSGSGRSNDTNEPVDPQALRNELYNNFVKRQGNNCNDNFLTKKRHYDDHDDGSGASMITHPKIHSYKRIRAV